MIIFTVFFATLALLFKTMLATVGAFMAVMVFIFFLVTFCSLAIDSLLETLQ